jgi:cell division transport system permease protein
MITRVQNYFIRHAQNCVGSLGTMSRQPLATALTIAVIGIALAMPAAMNILVQNARAVTSAWDNIRDFSVYMTPGTGTEDAERLKEELSGLNLVESVRFITAEQALLDFQNDPGFAAVISALDENPLPHTLIVRPDADATPESLEKLGDSLVQRDDIDLVKLDTQWLARLNAFLDICRRGVMIAAAMLLGAVIIIVGNTIRLDIQNRRQQIEVSKLLGASDAFVRRPFLYLGFWYGIFGGIFALLLLGATLLLLDDSVQRLIGLYDSSFEPRGIDRNAMLAVLAGGLVAGLGGAWSAVARHLAAIQPKV